MKLTDLNEAKRSPKQGTALRVLKDFDKSVFNAFKMIRADGSLTKSLLALFKGDPTVDFEAILDDIDQSLRNTKKDIKTLSNLIKKGLK